MPIDKKTAAMSLADLDAKFNPSVIIPAKIKAGLEKLGEHAMVNDDFRKLAEVNPVQLAAFADQFEEFQVRIRADGKTKILWCGTKAFTTKAKERLLT